MRIDCVFARSRPDLVATLCGIRVRIGPVPVDVCMSCPKRRPVAADIPADFDPDAERQRLRTGCCSPPPKPDA